MPNGIFFCALVIFPLNRYHGIMVRAVFIFQPRTYARLFGFLLLTVLLSACGGSGGVGGGGGASSSGGSPTLGITSIPRSSGTVTKPSLVSNFFGEALRFISGEEALAAANCAPSVFAQSFPLKDGSGALYILEAVAIVDEVEFEISSTPDSDDGPEFGPFAIDLTDTDDDVPNAIPLTVPVGDYDRMKIKVQRFEDTVSEQPVNVSDLPALRSKIGFDANNEARPSLWIKGVIEETDTQNCSDFQFITDRRSTTFISFTDTIDPTRVDTVLQFNLEGAFENANAVELVGELLTHSKNKPLDDGVLDGRLKDPGKFGTPAAMLIAKKLAESENVEVFTQEKGSFTDDPSGVAEDAIHHTAG